MFKRILKWTGIVLLNAELTEKYKKKVFVNDQYERKPAEWKMIFRAGKDVCEITRGVCSAMAERTKVMWRYGNVKMWRCGDVKMRYVHLPELFQSGINCKIEYNTVSGSESISTSPHLHISTFY